MTYEKKAKIFERAFADNGGNVAAALRQLDRECHPRYGRSKLTAEQLKDLHARRLGGAKLAELSALFGISVGYASYLCISLRPGKQPAAYDTRAAETAENIAA